VDYKNVNVYKIKFEKIALHKNPGIALCIVLRIITDLANARKTSGFIF
jgi:hypothetical protein